MENGTNCGSQLVDMLENRISYFVKNSLYKSRTDRISSMDEQLMVTYIYYEYQKEYIEWLQAKTQRQINYKYEKEVFKDYLKDIHKPTTSELEDIFEGETKFAI